MTQAARACWAKLVEEGVFAFVSDQTACHGPSDAGLGGLPEELCVGMFGELVKAHITAIDAMAADGGEGKDARLVVELM